MAELLASIGTWTGSTPPAFDQQALSEAIPRIRELVHVVREGPRGRIGLAFGGQVKLGAAQPGAGALPVLASLPALYPEWLGERSFTERHQVRFPYVAGAMANGIASPELVVAMAKAEMLAFFGAGGLSLARVEQGLDAIEAGLASHEGSPPSWGANLIHSPNEPALEAAVAELYIRRGVRRVSASAYMDLTAPLVRYACTGLRRVAGRVERRHHVFAKVSRVEVARRFMSPAPAAMLDQLVGAGQLSAQEAALARELPLAEDLTAEADSGGHTDNRPLGALFSVLAAARDEATRQHGYARPIRLGAAGGLGTPSALASAFALGAAYVLTGSVNQAAVQSGMSEAGRALLARADMSDVAMAPSPDMFEMGVQVQVLKRGTMFAQRAAELYRLYQAYESIEAIPAPIRARLEDQVFRSSLAQVWAETERFWAKRGPEELERAARDPRHRMALMFRWYVGLSSRWAIAGQRERALDYQIWCGPAMGAFNAWAAGSVLEPPEARDVVQIARNLLEGAAVLTRAHQLRSHGVPVPVASFDFRPRLLS